MPLFLLRDGSIRRCTVVPDGLRTSAHRDPYGRSIQVILDVDSERALLRAQPSKAGSRAKGSRLGLQVEHSRAA